LKTYINLQLSFKYAFCAHNKQRLKLSDTIFLV